MRYIIAIIFILLTALYAKVLELPVAYDPFLKAKKIISTDINSTQTSTQSTRLILIGIFNNKANINGKFYKIGDKVYEYTLSLIKDKYVILKKKGRVLILPIVDRKVLKMREQ
jgi:hypothetical protein